MFNFRKKQRLESMDRFPLEKPLIYIPKFKGKRIFGLEYEYGTPLAENLNAKIERVLLPTDPGFIGNGGRIYLDGNHLEYASPEASNPIEALIYSEVGEQICLHLIDNKETLYRNNCDRYGNTFAAHESYFTELSIENRQSIIPFLITRQIYTGAGHLKNNGIYELSQRAEFILYNESHNTTSHRGILNTREENHANVPGWSRLHLILGDANMCQSATLLKIGTTSLILELAETVQLPYIEYNDAAAVEDLRNISIQGVRYILPSAKKEAIEIQQIYLEKAHQEYFGRDQQTDLILNLWTYVLTKLRSDPESLFGVVDHITKKTLIETLENGEQLNRRKESDLIWMQSIDLAYHDVRRDNGIFWELLADEKIKRIYHQGREAIALKEPPRDTRAHIRGKLVARYPKHNIGSVIKENMIPREWEYCSTPLGEIEINDPFNNYDDELKLHVK